MKRIAIHQVVALIALFVAAAAPALAQETSGSTVLLPPEIALSSPEARQTLIVQRQNGSQFQGQVTEGIEFTSSDEKVVRVEGGQAIPVGNGKATIAVRV